MKRFATSLAVLLLVLAGAGCGGRRAAAPAPVTATSTLGPAGGALGVTGEDGTRFDLAVPAGALPSSTALTLTAVPPGAGQRFHVVLGPPGIAFDLLAPATLTIQPSGQPLAATGGLAVDGAAVPFSRGAGGALSVLLRSTSALAAAGQAPAGPRARAPAQLATVASCGTPTVSSTGVTGGDTVDIATYAACMQVAVDQLDATGRYEDAVRASLSVASLLQRLGGNGAGDAQTFLDAATATACRARGAAFSLAAGVTIVDLGEVFTFMRPMAYWEAVTQQLGASCAGQAAFSDAAGALTDKGLALYKANRPQVQDPAGARYHATVVEAQDARAVRGEVASLQAPGVGAVMDTQVKARAEWSLFDELLDGPWTSCRAGDDQPLLGMMSALRAPDEGKDVAQYCSVSITAEVFGPPSSPASLGTAGPLGDTAHGARTRRGAVKAALDGSLRLTGSARALTCPAGTGSPEALVLALNGHEVRRLTGPDYLGGPLDLQLTPLLQAAGLDPANPPGTLLLTIARDGAACSGYWGANPSPLLTIDLAPTRRIAFSCPSATAAYGTDLCTINPDGTGQARVVVDGAGPAWSHDRSRIAFNHANALTLVNSDGSGLFTMPLPANTYASSLSWSPDDTQLAFGALAAGPRTICFIGADGSGYSCFPDSALVLNGDGSRPSALDPQPAWSPDGTKIAFVGTTYQGAGPPANYAYRFDVYVMNADGTGAVNLTNNNLNPGTVQGSNPAWSPDGSRLAYVREDYYSGYAYEIYVTTPGGGVGTPLNLGGYASEPAWSPDGSRIAYTDLHTLMIMVVNADGSGVPTTVAPGTTPAW